MLAQWTNTRRIRGLVYEPIPCGNQYANLILSDKSEYISLQVHRMSLLMPPKWGYLSFLLQEKPNQTKLAEPKIILSLSLLKSEMYPASNRNNSLRDDSNAISRAPVYILSITNFNLGWPAFELRQSRHRLQVFAPKR